jgi:chromosomal replication initiator protein
MPSDDAEARLRTIAAIQRASAELFGVTVEELASKSNRGPVRASRRIAMYAASQITGASFAEIGQSFGGRRASSVKRIIAKIQAEKPFDVHLQGILTRLDEHLKPS